MRRFVLLPLIILGSFVAVVTLAALVGLLVTGIIHLIPGLEDV